MQRARQVLNDEISAKSVDTAFKAEKASAKPSKIDVFVEAEKTFNQTIVSANQPYSLFEPLNKSCFITAVIACIAIKIKRCIFL